MIVIDVSSLTSPVEIRVGGASRRPPLRLVRGIKSAEVDILPQGSIAPCVSTEKRDGFIQPPRSAAAPGASNKFLSVLSKFYIFAGIILTLLGSFLYLKASQPVKADQFSGLTLTVPSFDLKLGSKKEKSQKTKPQLPLLTSHTVYSIKTSLPPKNEKLPAGHYLKIPKIKLYTKILEDKNPYRALRKGVWRVYDYGTPNKLTKPTILAAHKFGYAFWSKDYKSTHAFYNLNKLKAGDTIEVIWDKRLFKYTVIKTEVSNTIKDIGAHLILYTCIGYNNPKRFIVYAERSN